MPQTALRVGILGQGRSGRNIHAEYLKDDTRFHLMAVADTLADRRERAEREYGCTAYADYRRLLDRRDLDLIVNALPSHLHVPVSAEALQAGHHVLCEKPLARYVTEVDRLIELSRQSDRLLAVFQQSRFAPYYQQIRRVIDSGVLGRIAMIKIRFNGHARRWDWQTLQDMYGGSLLNTGPHALDQILRLLDTEDMPEVWCRMDRVTTFGDAEDHVKIMLSAKDRPLVDLEISSCAAYPTHTYEIQGSTGGLVGSATEIRWRFYDPSLAPQQTLTREPLPGPAYCSEQLPWQECTWTAPPGDAVKMMSRTLYSNVYAAITEGVALEITPEQVRQQIAVIEECHRLNPMPPANHPTQPERGE